MILLIPLFSLPYAWLIADIAQAETDTIKYAMTSSVPSCNAHPETPVFGSAQFAGRTRLAQNLLSRKV